MRPIARDTSDFPDLRKRGCIYVDKSAEDALAQIWRKGYAAPYLASDKPVWTVGLSFDRTTRRLVSRAAERLA